MPRPSKERNPDRAGSLLDRIAAGLSGLTQRAKNAKADIKTSYPESPTLPARSDQGRSHRDRSSAAPPPYTKVDPTPKSPTPRRPKLDRARTRSRRHDAPQPAPQASPQASPQPAPQPALARSTSVPVLTGSIRGTNNRSTSGTTSREVECQICFTDAPIKKMLTCRGYKAHPFCVTCITKHVETQIGIMKCEMKCMSQEDCLYDFLPSKLQKVLGKPLYDKLMSIKQQQELQDADIEGLHECPFCDFKAIAPPIEEESQFACENPSCKKVSCRLCNKEGHKPKTCKEVGDDKHLGTKHRIEEAMSGAVIRHCPRRGCKTPMLKEYGCNKLQCPKCRTSMCYLCKKEIRNYDHFSPKTCPLHSNDAHDREAAQAREAATREAMNANPELKVEDVEVKAPPEGQGRGRRRSFAGFGRHFWGAAPFPMVQVANQPAPAMQRPAMGFQAANPAVAQRWAPANPGPVVQGQPWHGRGNVAFQQPIMQQPQAAAFPFAMGQAQPINHQPAVQYTGGMVRTGPGMNMQQPQPINHQPAVQYGGGFVGMNMQQPRPMPMNHQPAVQYTGGMVRTGPGMNMQQPHPISHQPAVQYSGGMVRTSPGMSGQQQSSSSSSGKHRKY